MFAPKSTNNMVEGLQNHILDSYFNETARTVFKSNLEEILVVCRLDGRIRVFF
jgi:hypothetical protein